MKSANDPFRLDGELALVTGGGTGLGRGIATALVGAGAKVCISGRRTEPLQQVVDELGKANCAHVSGDVTRADDRYRMLEHAATMFDAPLSILINNAGIHLKRAAAETSDEEYSRVIQTHVEASFALSRDAAAGMRQHQHGSIVFLASMTTYIGMPMVPAYTAAKAAVAGLTRALAAEWSADGVRVNAIAPGWIDSPMLRRAIEGDEQRQLKILGRTPMNRFGEPDDIGHAAVYLCSQAAKFVNGVVLPVDGGALIGF